MKKKVVAIIVYKLIIDSSFTASYLLKLFASIMYSNIIMYAQQYIILCPLFFTITCSSSCIPSPEQCGCSSVKPNFIESKVVGGYTARNHSWPWMGK